MGSFVKLYSLEPTELFVSRMNLSRRTMSNSFDAAFEAYLKCHAILDEVLFMTVNNRMDWMTTFGDRQANVEPADDSRRRHYQAQVEDDLADWQASLVLLFADDALQTLARGLLGARHTSFKGFGPEYPDVTNSGRPVRLSTLLRAATNTIRHVSEWEVEGLPYPYPSADKCPDRWRQAIQTIDVIKRAFGLGKDGPIRDVVSMRVLIAVDGTLYPGIVPTYGRFESAVIEAAREIASVAGASTLAKMDGQLRDAALEFERFG